MSLFQVLGQNLASSLCVGWPVSKEAERPSFLCVGHSESPGSISAPHLGFEALRQVPQFPPEAVTAPSAQGDVSVLFDHTAKVPADF